jgi:DNA-binding LacI/PurR family transcriptional regulator
MTKFTTMKDIAGRLGCSVPTVSSALSDRYGRVGISEAVRRKIKETAAEMGYHKNEIVRSLISGRTKKLAFIYKDEGWREYTSRYLFGFMRGAEEAGYYVRVFHLPAGEGMKNALRKMAEERIEGLCIRNVEKSDIGLIRDFFGGGRFPWTGIDTVLQDEPGLYFKDDDYSGIYQALSYLRGLGHIRIGHFYLGIKHTDERREAFRRAAAKLGLSNHPQDNIPVIGTYAENAARIRAFFDNNRMSLPSAFFCGSDYTAVMLIQEAYRRGLSVPGDLSVIGYADMDSARAVMPLTTVRQPFEKIGAAAARAIIEEIESEGGTAPDHPVVKRMKTTLIIRETTGPASAARETP